MASHPDRAHIDLPSSPPPSVSLTPPASFGLVRSFEQIDRPAHLEQLGVSCATLSSFHHKLNRVEFRVVNDAKFEEIVLDSVTNRHANPMYQEDGIEAEIKRRMKETVDRLHEDFDASKYIILRQVLGAFPDDQDLEFYLIRLLAADNTYDIRSFVAYGLEPMLKRLESRGPGRQGHRRAPRKKPAGRQNQAQPTQKPSSQSLKVPKAFSAPLSSSQESTSTITLRRSARLAQRHSQHQGIRKTHGKAR